MRRAIDVICVLSHHTAALTLPCGHGPEGFVFFHEFFIGALRHHAAVAQKVYLIAFAHGAETMSDEDDGDLVAKVVDRFHHRLFGEVVQSACGFVQDEHLRIVVQGSGNADALALTS